MSSFVVNPVSQQLEAMAWVMVWYAPLLDKLQQ
jgi:hypothetical protein